MKEQLLSLFLKSITVAVGISLVYIILTILTGPISFSTQSVQTTKSTFFEATGTGTVTLAPDTAEIMIGVTKDAGTVADAQKQVNTSMQAMITALKNLSIADKDITTTQYSIYPQYNPAGTGTNGYTATQTLDVKAPIDLASKVIDVATQNGANITGQVQFTLSDSVKAKAMQDARAKAVQDAKDKAQSLAGAAGIRLGKIVDVQEDSNNPVRIMPMMAAGGAKIAQDSTTLPAGSTTVTSNVTLSYQTN